MNPTRIDVTQPQPQAVVVADVIGQLEAVRDLTYELDATEFSAPTRCVGWDVHAVISHCYGTEAMLAGVKSPSYEGSLPEYVHNPIGEMNEPWVAALRTLDAASLVERYSEMVDRRILDLTALSTEAFHELRWTPKGHATYGVFLGVRIFDLWIHEQDIRVATYRPGGQSSRGAMWTYGEVRSAMGYVVGKLAKAEEGSVVLFDIANAPDGEGGFTMVVNGGRAQESEATQRDPDVKLSCSFESFIGAVTGRFDVGVAIEQGSISIVGDRILGTRLANALNYVP